MGYQKWVSGVEGAEYREERMQHRVVVKGTQTLLGHKERGDLWGKVT